MSDATDGPIRTSTSGAPVDGLVAGAHGLEFTCPRCGAAAVVARFYGPCDVCRDELGRTMQIAPRAVEVEAYAPKLNVVPNHVATKE